MTIEIMDTTKLCTYFPANPIPEIMRESFLDTIETFFEEYPVVIVEGPEGIGKTTLLSQFARKHATQTISIFIRPITRSSYDPIAISLDLLNQATWILTNKPLENTDVDLKGEWGKKKWDLAKRARINNRTYYFVIDGAAELPEEDSHYQEMIFDLLPFEHGDKFRFLISGDEKKLSRRLQKTNYKIFSMSGFTLEEVIHIFSDLNLEREDIKRLYQLSKTPSVFSSVRRSLLGGLNIDEFLSDPINKGPNVFEFEWKKVDFSDNNLISFLGIIAYSWVDFSLEEVCQIIGITEEQAKEFLKNLTFLIYEDNSASVRYVNEHFRKFASQRLYRYKDVIENKIIEYLNLSPEDSRSLISLPVLYGKSERYKELLTFLSPSRFIQILEINQSLLKLSEISEYAANGARGLGKDSDFVGYAIQASMFRQLLQSNVLESEINVLISLREMDAAIALVERATSREEKLFLLSVLMNAAQIHQLDIPDLENQVRNLYTQIDISNLGDRAIDIAANLINVLPDLAFEIVEKSAQADDEENALDIAFLNLSLFARGKHGDSFVKSGAMEKIQNRIQNPAIRKFYSANIAFLDYPASKITHEVERVEHVSEKLFIIRNWILKNRESEEAVKVVEYGLKIIISTTDYAPSARDYRELAIALPYVNDKEKLRNLIQVFDGQKGTVEKLGPVQDYVRLLLTLALAENKLDFEYCKNRLEEIYLYVCDIKDLETKSICMARLLSTLVEMDPDGKLEECSQLHSLVERDLEESVDKLLKDSADHYVISRGIIRALAKNRPALALDIALSLNRIDRRDSAIFDLIKYHLELPDEKITLPFVRECIGKISSKGERDKAILEIMSRLSSANTLTKENSQTVRYFLTHLSDIQSPYICCNACSLSFSILKFFEEDREKLQETILRLLEDSWNAIDPDWDKVDVGLKIVEVLYKFPEIAKKYLMKIDQLREKNILASEDTAKAFILNVYLCLKCFNGLITNNNFQESDLKRIYRMIDFIPSGLMRIELYTELALRFLIQKNDKEASQIVRTKIKPEIERFDRATENYQIAIKRSAPALYFENRVFALSLFDDLPIDAKEETIYRVIYFILYGRLDTEPYYEIKPQIHRGLSYENIIEIITLIEKLEDDSMIYSIINPLSRGVYEDRNRFSAQQREDIAQKIKSLIPRKFPNPKYITHEGYILVTEAQVLRIKSLSSKAQWNEILDRARRIENSADRVFILAEIAEAMPNTNKFREDKEQILEEAYQQIELIPNVQDRIGRCEVLAQVALDSNNRQLVRKYLQKGYEIAYYYNEADTTSQLRELIDFAYKFDPNLAASLASLFDDDPARKQARELTVKRRIEAAKLKEKFFKEEISTSDLRKYDDGLYISALWQLLGSLNSGRVAPLRLNKANEYTVRAMRMPFIEGYPIFSYLVQNAVILYQKTDQCIEYIRPLFESTLSCCDLILRLSGSRANFTNLMQFTPLADEERKSQIVDSSSPEKAKGLIINWLINHLKDYLFIADAYFGLEDLWVLQEINAINPKCRVFILTSKEHNRKYPQPWDEEYSNYWRINISEQDPPPTKITIIGVQSTGKSPIHDRWWVTNGAGLRMGTSLQSLGEKRISEISDMDVFEAKEKESYIRKFLIDGEDFHNGEKIQYVSFSL